MADNCQHPKTETTYTPTADGDELVTVECAHCDVTIDQYLA